MDVVVSNAVVAPQRVVRKPWVIGRRSSVAPVEEPPQHWVGLLGACVQLFHVSVREQREKQPSEGEQTGRVVNVEGSQHTPRIAENLAHELDQEDILWDVGRHHDWPFGNVARLRAEEGILTIVM